jgi:hypothetical protein
LLQRGRALRQIGDVRASQGRPDDALTLYDAALEIFARATPRDSGVLFEQAQTHLAASGVHYGRRDLPQSTTETLRFRELMAMLVERNPGNGDYLAELATADNNLGALAMADSDTDAADAHFRNALATVERLIAESPNDAGLRTLAARLQIWLGEVEDRRGHVDESLTWYRDGLEQHRVAVRLEATPANREALSSTLTILTVALRENDPRASLAYADDAIAELRALTAHDPDNADWRMRLNRAIVIAVGSELELGCAARIPKLLAEVRDSTDALLANDATGIENLRNRVDADVLAARYAIGMADLDEAAARADAAARQAAVLLERNPDDDISRRYYLRAVWVQVRSRRLTGAADAGRRAAQDAVAIIGHDAIEDPATATVAERLRAVAAGASGSEPAGRGNRCDGG